MDKSKLKEGFIETSMVVVSGGLFKSPEYKTVIKPVTVMAETIDHYIVRLQSDGFMSGLSYRKIKKTEFIPRLNDAGELK